MSEVDALRQELEELRAELEKQRRINEVLVRRVERTTDDSGNAFALFQRNTLLEHEVRARTRELERANAELTAANVAKSDFLANMSHELRTPLNAIMGMTSLMIGSAIEPEHLEYLEIVRTSADALLELIDDVLDFARLEAGRLELAPVPIDLCVALEEVVDVLSVRATEQRIELVSRFTSQTPRYVMADPGRLRQIIMNLLGNALKFTDDGWVEIRAKGAEVDGRAVVALEVEDTGIGIAEAGRSRIFDKFHQVDESSTRRYGGAGLGLAISKQLVTLMGGSIEVQSERGRGSTFTVHLELPLVVDHPPIPMPPLVAAGARLLVAAQPSSRSSRALVCQLEDWGLHVGEVGLEDVVEAVESDGGYDVVFIDEPKSGLSAERIAAISSIAPVVCLLAARGTPSQRAALRSTDHVVWKPVGQTDLLHVLDIVWRERVLQNGDRPAAASTKTVLVVEDNDVNQHVAERILQRCGYEAQIAADGEAAVRAVEERSFDLVLMDIQMPVVDGFEAARRIRALEEEKGRSPMPIVAMTANVTTGIEARCSEAGMDDYISKPVRLDTVRAMLEAWVGRGTKSA